LLKRDDLSAADRVILQSAIRQIIELNNEIEKLEAEIIRLDKNLKGIKRLLQLHGMNLLSAISLLAEIGSIELFETSKQLVAYSGLATSIRQSNEMRRSSFSAQKTVSPPSIFNSQFLFKFQRAFVA
jgi:transposase